MAVLIYNLCYYCRIMLTFSDTMFKNETVGKLLMCVLSLFFCFPLNAQYSFKNMNSSDGLSSNSINAIYRDKKGFLWIGTNFGLNRYDGYTIKSFFQNPQDTTSLKNNYINAIDEDCEGLLWINTRGGVLVFDPEKECFLHDYQAILRKQGIKEGDMKHVMNKDSLSGYILQDSVVYIYNHAGGRLCRVSFDQKRILYGAFCDKFYAWLIDDSLTVYKVDTKDGSVRGVYTSPFKCPPYKQACVYVDEGNGLWIILDKKKLLYYDSTRDDWRDFANQDFVGYPITSIAQVENQMCIGTDHGGVYYMDRRDFSVSNVRQNANRQSLSDNSVTCLHVDSENILWIGTYKHGVDHTHSSFSLFQTYRVSTNRAANDINCFVEDRKGNIWIGTNIDGLYMQAKNSVPEKINYNGKKDGTIVCLIFDKKDRLWIGTYLDGLYCYDHGQIKHYMPGNCNIDYSIWNLTVDDNGILWVGTLNRGLLYFDETLSDFVKAPCAEELGTTIEYLFVNDRKQLVVGGSYGFFILTPQGQIQKHVFFNNPDDRISEKNYINYISQDKNGYYWVCTQSGLAIYDKELNNYRFLKKEDGIGQEFVYVALIDRDNNVWVSTSKGLFRVHLNDYQDMADLKINVESFCKENGLQDNIFNKKAGIIAGDASVMYFGGVNGYNKIYPDKLKKNEVQQNLQFTELFINNKVVEVGNLSNGRVLLEKSLSYCQNLNLKYDENNLLIKFSSLNLLSLQRCKYEYMLEGGDGVWYSLLGEEPYVAYNNLNPGKYKLIIRSVDLSNQNHLNEKELLINITPPFWLTWQAYLLYALIILLAVSYIVRNIVKQATLHLKLQQEQAEKRHIEDLSNMKVSFFTNLSHELRTPVSLIISPIETIIAKDPVSAEKHNLKMVLRNAKRLLFIVNQLLDFRKIEVGELSFNPLYGDVVSFLRDTAASFIDMAYNRNINFSFQSNVKELYLNFDPGKMERILFNLLSNAFKYTSAGYVKINIDFAEGREKPLLIQVEDSGIGMEQDILNHIFTPFYQAQSQKSLLSLGTGIGLSIVKSFVELHHGEIHVSSTVGEGTTFRLCFAVEGNCEILNLEESEMTILSKHLPITVSPKEKTILIADDNDDLRFYLRDNLVEKYNIIEAENGLVAYEKALRFIPDMIVADIMMPVMTGVELCGKIKNDLRVSHIPVLLLTAATSDEFKIDSYKVGANAYLTKPCNVVVLEARISNLLLKQAEQQVAINKRSESEAVQPAKSASLDEKVLQDVIKITELYMGEADFSICKLSKEVGMSTVYLNKKISALTGKTTSEYVRYLRMKKACLLLSKTQKTISEIAYEVGYSMPKYFSKHFKEEFGSLPSEYRKNIY